MLRFGLKEEGYVQIRNIGIGGRIKVMYAGTKVKGLHKIALPEIHSLGSGYLEIQSGNSRVYVRTLR